MNCPQDAFGGDDDGAINIKIELDFAWPRAGPVKIICEGEAGHVRVLNNEESIVSIESNAVSPKEVELKRTKATVSKSIQVLSVEMTPFEISKSATQILT